MDRREAVKRISLLLGVSVSAPTMAGILGGCQPSAPGTLRVLSGEQHRKIGVLVEHILPTTDTPGAREAGVAEFVDAMLADFYSEEERFQFMSGFGEVDASAQGAYGKVFMECTESEQFDVLNALDREAFPDLGAMSNEERVLWEAQRAQQGKPFIATLKELTLAGYYTSEIGAAQELHVNPMGEYRADIPYEEVGRAWS